MKVFSTFFKIAKKNIGTIIMFTTFSILISSLTSQFKEKDDIEQFKATRLDIAVIDRDASKTSKGITDYIASSNSLISIKDDTSEFQDKLYYRKVDSIVILPKGLEEDLIAGKELSIQSIEIPNSYSGIFFRMELNSYMNLLKNYLNTGFSPEEALTKTNETKSIHTNVTLTQSENIVKNCPAFYNYFIYLPYAIVGILVAVIGIILLAFNKSDLKKRMTCSSMPLRQKNLQLTLGCMAFAAVITIILLIPPIILYGVDIIADPNFIYLFLNQIAMTITGIALAFLVGMISKTPNHISIASTTLSLALNFLGGIFVPLFLLPSSMIKFCKFIPTYWYSLNMDLISTHKNIVDNELTTFIQNLSIQLLFAVVLFGIALVVSRQSRENA